MKVSYSGTVGMQQAAYIVPMANAAEYINYREAFSGLPTPATGYSTNWYNQVLRNAFYQNHNLSVSGGNSQDKYALSASYQTNDGIIIFNNYNRFTVRLNNEFDPNYLPEDRHHRLLCQSNRPKCPDRDDHRRCLSGRAPGSGHAQR